MNRNRVLVVTACLAIVVVAVIALQTTAPDSTDDAFAPYQPDTNGADTASASDEGGAVADRATARSAPPRKPAAADDGIVKLPNDELNRPGPTGAAAEARRVVNRRPRGDDEEPGLQDERPTGELAREDVQAGIEAVRPLVKECYDETLSEFPDAEGKVTIGFRIHGEDGKGRVEMSELEDDSTTLFDQTLHDCMQKGIAEAQFATPSGGGVVNVRYPFIFHNDADQ